MVVRRLLTLALLLLQFLLQTPMILPILLIIAHVVMLGLEQPVLSTGKMKKILPLLLSPLQVVAVLAVLAVAVVVVAALVVALALVTLLLLALRITAAVVLVKVRMTIKTLKLHPLRIVKNLLHVMVMFSHVPY
ncbi:hypothetical protein A264_28516 [Pseudomonas syringae pv. actinidiae ICMP 19071]|nr:hypothetical protein A264_28516 [Pseudomonas syringae pv. actinidiae ICMP 19071]EPM73879.1 hypothetical protein A3SO_27738 [Pseudomonas syringae pv. actinidiae ICMP 19072]